MFMVYVDSPGASSSSGGSPQALGYRICSQAVASLGSWPSASSTLLSSTSRSPSVIGSVPKLVTSNAAGSLEVQHSRLGVNPAHFGTSEQVTAERRRPPVEVERRIGAVLLEAHRGSC